MPSLGQCQRGGFPNPAFYSLIETRKEKFRMMRVDAFARSLSAAAPPERANLALQALWWASKGEWERAHRCAQQARRSRL